MPKNKSTRTGGFLRRKHGKFTIIRTTNPAWTTYGSGQPGIFASLFDAFTRGGSHQTKNGSSSSSGPAGTDGEAAVGEPENGTSPDDGLGMGAPILPAVLFIGSLALLALVFLESGPKKTILQPGRLTHPDAAVWVIRDTGNFYCRGSLLWGKQPGQLMQQSDALEEGYQPAFPGYCRPVKTDAATPKTRSMREPRSAVRSEGNAAAASPGAASRAAYISRF